MPKLIPIDVVERVLTETLIISSEQREQALQQISAAPGEFVTDVMTAIRDAADARGARSPIVPFRPGGSKA